MQCNIKKIIINPEQKPEYIENLLKIEGNPHIPDYKRYREYRQPKSCYCALPLTGVPEKERQILVKKQEIIKAAIGNAGISVYDPACPDEEGMSPWGDITETPKSVYDYDMSNVITREFYAFTNLGPSTGAGIEQKTAFDYLKKSVIVTENGEYVSRLSTGMSRQIILGLDDFKKQSKKLTELFELLLKYETGVGICDEHGNTLIGYNDDPVCLPGLVENLFPDLVFNFDQYLTSKA